MRTGSQCFGKAERLRSAEDFRSITRNAEAVWENGVVLYCIGANQHRQRFGVIVSRKVFKRATERNRIKRCAREFFRLRKGQLRGGVDLVVRVVDSYNLLYKKNLWNVLDKLFHRSGLLQAD